MKAFNKIENELINNPNYFKLLEGFHFDNWTNITAFERFRIFEAIDHLVEDLIGKDLLPKDEQGDLNLPKEYYQKSELFGLLPTFQERYSNPIVALREYFKELRLKYQVGVINKENKGSDLDEDTYQNLKVNYNQSVVDYDIVPFAEGHDLYLHQPMMVDAYEYADKMLDLTFKNLPGVHPLRGQVELYLCNDRVMHDSIKSEAKRAKALKIIEEKSAAIDVELDEIFGFFEKIDTEMIEDLEDDKLDCLISPLFDHILPSNVRSSLSKEYAARKLRLLGINKSLPDVIMSDNNPNFVNTTDLIKRGIIYNLDDYNADPKIVRDLKINTYKKGDKLVNYILDKNIDHYIQPVSLLKNSIINENKKTITKSLSKHFKSPKIINVLDRFSVMEERIIAKVIERYYGCSFEEYYEKLVKKMETRITKQNPSISR
ncbi:TPA: hypothetical protein GXZ34_01500 [bacterium]|nr:hypothetical protein [bacterium]